MKRAALQNLGYRTDLMIVSAEVDIIEREHYLVARSPANPDWHCGNFLLFDQAPSKENAATWFDAFQREIADRQPTEHIRFGWDANEQADWDMDAFTERNMEFEALAVLVRQGPPEPPRHHNHDIEIRALTTKDDWAAATQGQIDQRESIYGLEGYTRFKTAEMQRHRRQAEAGKGAWFGAWLGGQLVGDLGIFSDGKTARYQAVGTHPDFRRRGICQTLVWHAGTFAVEALGAQTLVIAAEFGKDAIRVYRSLGFEEKQKQFSLSWFEKSVDSA